MAEISGVSLGAAGSHVARPTSPDPETRLYELTGETISAARKDWTRHLTITQLRAETLAALNAGYTAAPILVETSKRCLDETLSNNAYSKLKDIIYFTLMKISRTDGKCSIDDDRRSIIAVQALKRLARNRNIIQEGLHCSLSTLINRLVSGDLPINLYDDEMNSELHEQATLALRAINSQD
jgi:hypothetical protein